MRIGIDIDDTISNTYEYLFPYAQKYTIEELGKEIENINRESITHMYTTTFHNWNKKEESEFFKKYYQRIINNVKPKFESVEIINKLKEQGNKIYIITARFEVDNINVKEETQKWLDNNGILYDELIINAQNKAEIAKDINIEIFIDDSIKNCKNMAQIGIKTFIMDSIVNLKFEDENVKRVYSWPHLYHEITKIKEVN